MNNRALPGGKNTDKDPEDVVIIDPEYQDITDLQGDIDDTLNSITQEFDADGNDQVIFMKVYRVQDKTGKSSWLFNCQPEELPIMEKLRDSYGTGIYQVRVYKNKKLYRRFNYQIEAPKPGQTLHAQPQPAVDLAGILQAMNAQSERSFQQMKELVTQTLTQRPTVAAPAFDIMRLLEITPALLAGFKALMPAQQDNSGVLLKALEIGANMAGGGKETNFLDVAKEALNSIGPVLAAQMQQPRALPRPVAARPTGAPVNPATQIPAQSNAPVQQSPTIGATMDLSPLKGHIDFLVSKALKGAEPALYADMIADNVPAETIKQYLLQDSLIADLKAVNPRVAECEQWFLQLKNELLQIFEVEPGETLTESVDTNDTSSDAPNEPLAAVVPNGNPTGTGGS